MLPATTSDFFLQMCLYEKPDIRIGLFVCNFCRPYPQGVCLCGHMGKLLCKYRLFYILWFSHNTMTGITAFFYHINLLFACSPLSTSISCAVIDLLTTVIKYAHSAISSSVAHLGSSV